MRVLTVLQATVERQKAELAVVAPKAKALDRIATADSRLSIAAAAKAPGNGMLIEAPTEPAALMV
ncbi:MULTISPECIES: phage antirepressor KilAC domain-containing protein [Roseomonadaceae]|uniref:Uncharacterized protein n=1 Tax=Falsiroseomonas oleicola TaxID=2801474 RepID=A0ABS6HAN3_9PROT|nr:phage antirepressor KilAC domain-containing protein [Roseomonas oleicola]MBU8545792.1 hypothetical protein [Roseomonas oleicola]